LVAVGAGALVAVGPLETNRSTVEPGRTDLPAPGFWSITVLRTRLDARSNIWPTSRPRRLRVSVARSTCWPTTLATVTGSSTASVIVAGIEIPKPSKISRSFSMNWARRCSTSWPTRSTNISSPSGISISSRSRPSSKSGTNGRNRTDPSATAMVASSPGCKDIFTPVPRKITSPAPSISTPITRLSWWLQDIAPVSMLISVLSNPL